MAETPSKIRLVCVDDNPLVLEGLQRSFGATSDVEVVATLERADELLAVAQRAAADVVLLDLEMPGADALRTLAALSTAVPRIRVVVLTGVFDPGAIERALDAGAFGFVTKDDAPAMIMRAVRAAAAGKSTFSDGACRMHASAGS